MNSFALLAISYLLYSIPLFGLVAPFTCYVSLFAFYFLLRYLGLFVGRIAIPSYVIVFCFVLSITQ